MKVRDVIKLLAASILALLAVCVLTNCAAPRTTHSAEYERGYWAGWKQHAKTVGGGL